MVGLFKAGKFLGIFMLIFWAILGNGSFINFENAVIYARLLFLDAFLNTSCVNYVIKPLQRIVLNKRLKFQQRL